MIQSPRPTSIFDILQEILNDSKPTVATGKANDTDVEQEAYVEEDQQFEDDNEQYVADQRRTQNRLAEQEDKEYKDLLDSKINLYKPIDVVETEGQSMIEAHSIIESGNQPTISPLESLLGEFDIRKAVIYSEILNRKY